MPPRNICRFTLPTAAGAERLETLNFIYESDTEVMTEERVISANRMILAVTGSGEFLFDGESLPFASGDLFFAFAGERFCVRPHERCEYMYITFCGLRGEELLRRFSVSRENRFRTGMEGLIPLWRESLSRAADENVDLSAESILLYTFSRLTPGNRNGEDAVSRMTRIMEENFSDPELTLGSLAAELGYNTKYLSHVFREKRGIGFSEYLKNLRIRHAVFLFDHGIDSVKNVALLSGFTDPLYFSSVFKKTVGVSPKEYRVNAVNGGTADAE